MAVSVVVGCAVTVWRRDNPWRVSFVGAEPAALEAVRLAGNRPNASDVEVGVVVGVVAAAVTT